MASTTPVEAQPSPLAPPPFPFSGNFFLHRFPTSGSSVTSRLNCILLNYLQREENFSPNTYIEFKTATTQNIHSAIWSTNPATGDYQGAAIVQIYHLTDVPNIAHLCLDICLYKDEKLARIDYTIATRLQARDINNNNIQVNDADFMSHVACHWSVATRLPGRPPLTAMDVKAWDTPPLGVILYLLRRQSYICFNSNGGPRDDLGISEAEMQCGLAFPAMEQVTFDGNDDPRSSEFSQRRRVG